MTDEHNEQIEQNEANGRYEPIGQCGRSGARGVGPAGPSTTAGRSAAEDGNRRPSDSRTRGGEGYTFTSEQMDAIATLASSNTYAKQSKWKTFCELPSKDKWPFFVQHFLLGVAIAVAVLALVISLVVTYVTRPPSPELSVAGFGMSSYSEQLDALRNRFVKDVGIGDERLIDIDGSFGIDTSGTSYTDDSAKVLTMVTAGTINMVVADRDTFPTLVEREYVTEVTNVESGDALAALEESGALVGKDGEPVEQASEAMGLDLSKSAVWSETEGLPDDAIIGFSNIVDTADRARDFIEFLDFS